MEYKEEDITLGDLEYIKSMQTPEMNSLGYRLSGKYNGKYFVFGKLYNKTQLEKKFNIKKNTLRDKIQRKGLLKALKIKKLYIWE